MPRRILQNIILLSVHIIPICFVILYLCHMCSMNCWPFQNIPVHPRFLVWFVLPDLLVFWVMFCRSLFVLLSFFFWPLCCMSYDLRLLITPLVSFGHCVVCPMIYVFWLPLWYLLAIVLYVLWFTSSDYPFGIFWPLCCMSYDLRLLITPLVSFGHCVVCPMIYVFWLPLWYLLAIVLYVLRFTVSDYPFGIFWPLCCMSYDLRLLITPLVSFGHCVVCPMIYVFGIFWPLCCMSYDLRFLITSLVSFGHCVVCPMIYVFW